MGLVGEVGDVDSVEFEVGVDERGEGGGFHAVEVEMDAHGADLVAEGFEFVSDVEV